MSTIIAVLALAVSITTAYFTVRQHRISVTPHLVRETRRDRRPDGIVISTDICNHGMGPAKIKKFDLFLDDKPFTSQWDPVETLLKAGLDGKVSYQILRQGHPNKDYSIMAGQTYHLAEIFLPGAEQSDEHVLNEHFKRMQFRIEYESFHGVPFVLDSRK